MVEESDRLTQEEIENEKNKQWAKYAKPTEDGHVVWTGGLKGSAPAYIMGVGGALQLAVRKELAERQNLKKPDKNHWATTTCTFPLCVAPDHIGYLHKDVVTARWAAKGAQTRATKRREKAEAKAAGLSTTPTKVTTEGTKEAMIRYLRGEGLIVMTAAELAELLKGKS